MEARKITIKHTTQSQTMTIMSAATTLGELKADLDLCNIDYTDMSFLEGISKTELLNNESVLPKDLNYKGNITNELVFLLSKADKKIASGITIDDSDFNTIVRSLAKGSQDEELQSKDSLLPDLASSDDSVDIISLGKEVSDIKKVINDMIELLVGEDVLYRTDAEVLKVNLHSAAAVNHKCNSNCDSPKVPNLESSYSDSDVDDMFGSL